MSPDIFIRANEIGVSGTSVVGNNHPVKSVASPGFKTRRFGDSIKGQRADLQIDLFFQVKEDRFQTQSNPTDFLQELQFQPHHWRNDKIASLNCVFLRFD